METHKPSSSGTEKKNEDQTLRHGAHVAHFSNCTEIVYELFPRHLKCFMEATLWIFPPVKRLLPKAVTFRTVLLSPA